MSTNVKLRIGQISGGNLTAGSMAAAIYDQMLIDAPLRPKEDPLPRQRFAIAIATGVINHLVANNDAFVVDVRDSGGSPSARTVRIDKWP
jgi:hypothetical protein